MVTGNSQGSVLLPLSHDSTWIIRSCLGKHHTKPAPTKLRFPLGYFSILLQVKSFQYINILTCHLYCWCLTCSLMLFSKNCSVIAVSTSSSCKIGSKLLLSVAFVPIGLNFFFELNWFQASISIWIGYFFWWVELVLSFFELKWFH